VENGDRDLVIFGVEYVTHHMVCFTMRDAPVKGGRPLTSLNRHSRQVTSTLCICACVRAQEEETLSM